MVNCYYILAFPGRDILDSGVILACREIEVEVVRQFRLISTADPEGHHQPLCFRPRIDRAQGDFAPIPGAQNKLGALQIKARWSLFQNLTRIIGRLTTNQCIG